jgi:hypothetical protein
MDDDQMLAMASVAAVHAKRLSFAAREGSGGGGAWSMAHAADAILGSVRAQKAPSQPQSQWEGVEDGAAAEEAAEGAPYEDEAAAPEEASNVREGSQPRATSKELANSLPPTTAASASEGAAPGAAAAATLPEESILKFMREMRAHLGRIQLILHRYNTYFLRLRALQTWKDNASTCILLAGLATTAVWLALVPTRVTFALASLYAFARPLRFSGKSRGRRSVGDAVLHQWLDGIPLAHPTHRRVAVAVQMALEDPPTTAIAAVDV